MMTILKRLASLKVALIGLSGLFVIVLWGTFKQIDYGIFYTQKYYFQSPIIYYALTDSLKLPVFFGGVVWGTLLSVNLIAVLLTHIRWQLKNIGLILIHVGLLGLFIGSFLTGKLAQESQLIISEGETKQYSINTMTPELIISFPYGVKEKQFVIPFRFLKEGQKIVVNDDLILMIDQFYVNSRLIKLPALDVDYKGLGRHYFLQEISLDQSPEGQNTIGAIIKILDSQETFLGNWIVSQGINTDQLVQSNGKKYYLTLRDQRIYTDYSIRLIDFKHDVYPGTSIPKNFSSLVEVFHPRTGEKHDALIYMNHPLRYQGNTYYQSSFGDEDTLSVLQVVRNPVWLFPYLSTLVISLGLLIHFLMMLLKRKRP